MIDKTISQGDVSISMNGDGHVTIIRGLGESKWRRVIMPHSRTEIDEFCDHYLTDNQKQQIFNKWRSLSE